MFSSLPKLADKNFIIAFLVPTLAFGVALAWAFPGLAALAARFLGAGASLTEVTVAAAAVWFLAVALLLANHIIYRAMEGYLGPLSSPALKAWMTRRWLAETKSIDDDWEAVEALPQDQQAAANGAVNDRTADFRRRYPRKVDRILGTPFGNINRAFEAYAGRVYGVDAITIWPRLSAVIPSAFQTVLSDARAQVDCFLNLTALALLFAAIEVGRCCKSLGQAFWQALPDGVGAMTPLLSRTAVATDWWPLGPAVAALVFALITYRMLLDSAVSLGERFKAAFDLYLGSLPKQLGYALPQGAVAQKAFWDGLRNSYRYFDPAPQDHRLKAPPGPAQPGDVGAMPGAAADGGDGADA